MTVPSETNRSGPYNGNGVTTVFGYGFRIVDEGHLRVIKTSAEGVETVLVIDADYIVSDVGDPAGGQIALMVAPPSGETITILRNVPFTQDTDLENQGAYYAETVEDALDLAAMRDQQLAEEIERSVRVPASAGNVDTELPVPEAGKIIAWNDGATGLTNLDRADLASVVAYGTAVFDILEGDGATTVFEITYDPAAIGNLDIAIGGVTQLPGVDYMWTSGKVLTFASPPADGVQILVRYMRALPQISSDGNLPGMDDLYYQMIAATEAALAASENAQPTSYEFTATDGQTAFVLPFAFPTAPIVWRDGVRLSAEDFSYAAGAVTLDTACDAGDLVVLTVGEASIVPYTTADRVNGLSALLDLRASLAQLDIPSAFTSASIQAVVETEADNGQHVRLLKGDHTLSSAITSGAKAVAYQGAGPLASRLLVGGAFSAIQHGLGVGQPVYFSSFAMSGVGIFATQAGPNAPAIDAELDRDGGGFTLENVTIGAWSAAYGFPKYVRIVGGSRTTFRTVRLQGSVFGNGTERAAGPQIGVHIISNNNADKSYEYVFDDVLVEAEVNGFLFECLGSAGDSGSLEGISFKDVRGRSNIGPWIDFRTPNDGTVWMPPVFVMGQGCNYQGSGAIAHFDGIEHFIMRDNWHACDAAISGSPSLNQVQVANGRKIAIENNTFRIFDAAHLEWVISILSGCSDVTIANNTFIYEGSPVVNGGGIFIDVSVASLKIEGNVFIGWPSGLPKAQWSNGQSIQLDDPITRSGTTAGATDGSGQLTVNFPTRPQGGNYFSAAPNVVISNGDSTNGRNELFSLVAASVTATGFKVQVVDTSNNPVIGAARRVNWLAHGGSV